MKEQFAIGIDVGGSSLKCGTVNRTGKIVHTFLQPLPEVKSEYDVITLIAAAIRKCAVEAGGAVSSVGIGFPGIVDKNIIIGGVDNLPGFENVPLGKLLQQETGYDIIIDNDANMMGFGELIYGAAQGCDDIVFLTVGTGIGGALVFNKRLYGGYKNRGAELGHIIIRHNGATCSCGTKGCLEAYASIPALINFYRDSAGVDDEAIIDGKLIVHEYLQSNAGAIEAMQQHFDYLATGVASYINIFSPQKVIIGGGISEAGDFYIKEINKRVQQLAMAATQQNTVIAAASLGNKAGILGCAAQAFNLSQVK